MHLFLGHCGLIFAIGPYNWVNFGGPLPLNGGGASRGKRWGPIYLIEIYWPVRTLIGHPSKLGRYYRRKFRGPKLGFVCGLSLSNSGYKRLKF